MGIASPVEVLRIDPQIQVVDSTLPAEIGSGAGAEVVDETSGRPVDNYVASVAGGTHGSEQSAHLCDMIQDFGLHPRMRHSGHALLSHVWESSTTR